MNRPVGVAALVLLTAGMAAESNGARPGDAPGLPGDSLYQLQVSLETSQGVKLPLSSLRGKPLLITMFYSHCTIVCPLLAADLKNVDHAITAKEREHIRVLMVSFDAVRDTPDELKAFEDEHSIHDSRWIIARTTAGDVALLAAALGSRYRELPDHSFNHTRVISLADKDGRTGNGGQFIAPCLRASV